MKVDETCVYFVFLLIGAAIMMPMSIVIIAEYDHTTKFSSQFCSGELQHSDIHTSGIGCARGKTITTFQNSSGVFDKSVELYYPEVNWLLVCKKVSDVQSWLSGMSSSKGFDCFIDDPTNPGLPEGIRNTYPNIGGWIAMLVFSSIFLLICILMSMYVCCINCDSRKCCSCCQPSFR
jgi:hypothetical protein